MPWIIASSRPDIGPTLYIARDSAGLAWTNHPFIAIRFATKSEAEQFVTDLQAKPPQAGLGDIEGVALDPILYGSEQPKTAFVEFLERRARYIGAWRELNAALDEDTSPVSSRPQAERMFNVVTDVLIGACDAEGLTVF